jgi:hypothetical protein
MAKEKPAVELHVKKAKLGDLDNQAAKLRDMYEIYKSLRKLTPKPSGMLMDLNIRTRGQSVIRGERLTVERLQAEAARYRMLLAIKEHVATNVGDAQSFDLAFDLSCKDLPEIFPEFEGFGGGPVVSGPVAGPGG